ncbi:MAG: transketolase [Desulfomicrobiaceae bacterium]
MTTSSSALDLRCVSVLKGLVLDTVHRAKSGHPGGALSSADFAYVLFQRFLNFDPDDATWWNRDRFVLSAGHESALLYGLLTLAGFLSVEDLKAFRQWHSRTPGHPEHGLTPGVEATTGPLGQGLAMAVGMAIAEAMVRHFTHPDFTNHWTYVLASDGDLQEPVALGAAAVAGRVGLGRLIVFYDSNKIQLAGPTERSDATDYAAVFGAMGWHVQDIDGHDHQAIAAAITAAQAETTRPSLIIGHTTMAKGCATMEGSADTHGAPLPEDELRCTKARLGLPEETPFFLPEEVVTHFRSRHPELRALRAAWNARRDALLADATTAARLREVQTPVWERRLTWPTFEASGSVATRKAFGACLMALADQLPLLVGGSADLDPSNQTAKFRDTYGVFHAQDNPKGRNICFGVREFPMAAMLNGMALHGGVVPFGATFLVFSDYARNAIRMSALQELPVLHVFTHDSFFVGEDGPTHQPVEHLWSLRLIPNLLVFRPADARETAACMAVALRQKSRPSVFAFTRQGLPVLDHIPQEEFEAHVARGGYILWEPHDRPVEVIVIATGSEVSLAVEAVRRVPEIGVRVVSMPCVELFDEQPEDYRRTVLPETITRRIAVEAGCTAPWFKYVGPHGRVLGLDHFGASAPAKVLQERYGFTPENLARIIAETR